MIQARTLAREEIQRLWTIDRKERIDAVYRVEGGSLVMRPERIDVQGWPPGEAEHYTPILEACFDRGGWFCGLFDDGRLVGAAVLESRFIGEPADQLQLKFLHVDHAYRDRGLGRELFDRAGREAVRRGAARLYISATPSEHTIGFYLRLGCTLAKAPDPELLALEPDDVHLELSLA